jgi:hypothetical protein
VRPSVLDLRFQGDVWALDARDGTLALWLGNYQVAAVSGLPFELPHFNALLARLRTPRRSRRRHRQ